MEFSNEQVKTPLLCIHCNIRLTTLRRYRVLELNTRAISLICNWISPVIVTDEDFVCEACWTLTMQAINDELHADAGYDCSAGPSRHGHAAVCLICGRSLVSRQSDLIIRQNPTQILQDMMEIIKNRIAPRQISTMDWVCHACWLKTKRDATRSLQNDESRHTTTNFDVDEIQASPETEDSVESQDPSTSHQEEPPILAQQEDHAAPVQQEDHAAPVQQEDQAAPVQPSVAIVPGYRRGPNTASHCIFVECTNMFELKTISDSLRATVLSNYHYYIPKLARVCTEHLFSNDWDALYNAENSIETFTMDQIAHVFSFVNAFKPFLDFTSMEAVNEMDANLFVYWMGMTKENFFILLEELPRIRNARKGILGLAATLIKMRTGDSNERLSILMEVSRSTLERIMHSAMEILLQDFVSRNLGINNMPRESLLHHNLMIPNAIYNPNNSNAIVICDGTYIYMNKSSNYMFQKDSYSLHKYRNLLKPFLIVACDGYILDYFGPYKATTSDAEIMSSLFNNENSPLRQYFRDNDIFILDRGFRDSISLLESCNYRAYMPDSLLEGEHQLTTAQANRSRCVTICRWVVEVVNGYFKRDYLLLRFEHLNKSVPNMMAYFQIAASLINRFGVRFHDRVDASQIVEIIRERMPLQNNLARIVNEFNFNRRASLFSSITAHNDHIVFPRLEYNDLILFALGTYQLHQARSYYGEHIRFHGGYRIEVSRDNINVNEFGLRGSGNNSLIRAKIKSRHVGRRQYYVFILIENDLNGRLGITEYYCNCLVGQRTVGCCAHVMTVVWYLGWARHEGYIAPPAECLDYVVVREHLIEI